MAFSFLGAKRFRVEITIAYADMSRGKPTFLNFDEPYPSQIFTLLIRGSDRVKFGDPETAYRGKHVCVRGKIEPYKSVPEIVATNPPQVRV
jgi:hypothetical protein